MFRLVDTKNRETVELPLPGHIAARLAERGPGDAEGWVFPGTSKAGHYDSPYVASKVVAEASGVKFAPHDLRRTFITTGEGLDISSYTVKRLVNHKMNNDVTAGYVVPSFERLAAASGRIETKILSLANGEDS